MNRERRLREFNRRIPPTCSTDPGLCKLLEDLARV